MIFAKLRKVLKQIGKREPLLEPILQEIASNLPVLRPLDQPALNRLGAIGQQGIFGGQQGLYSSSLGGAATPGTRIHIDSGAGGFQFGFPDYRKKPEPMIISAVKQTRNWNKIFEALSHDEEAKAIAMEEYRKLGDREE